MIEIRNEEELSRLLVLMKSKTRNSYLYLSQPHVRVCPVCGEVFETKGRGRPKRFCSVKCRAHYHQNHPNMANWTTTRTACVRNAGKRSQLPVSMDIRVSTAAARARTEAGRRKGRKRNES